MSDEARALGGEMFDIKIRAAVAAELLRREQNGETPMEAVSDVVATLLAHAAMVAGAAGFAPKVAAEMVMGGFDAVMGGGDDQAH